MRPNKQNRSEMRGLKLGAIAFLDALGFKGIWTREDPMAVLQQLKNLRRNGLSLQGRDRDGVLLNDQSLTQRVRCVSDIIMVAVTLRRSDTPERYLYRAMLSASLIASSMIDDALHGSPPLLFRGCMAAGLMKVDGDFVIGPAVDEAAELYERSDGAFFWMGPSALTAVFTCMCPFLCRGEACLRLAGLNPRAITRIAPTHTNANCCRRVVLTGLGKTDVVPSKAPGTLAGERPRRLKERLSQK